MYLRARGPLVCESKLWQPLRLEADEAIFALRKETIYALGCLQLVFGPALSHRHIDPSTRWMVEKGPQLRLEHPCQSFKSSKSTETERLTREAFRLLSACFVHKFGNS